MATQRVKVNLSGLTIKGVTFSQTVMKPLLLPPMLLSGPHALQHAVSPMQNRCGGPFAIAARCSSEILPLGLDRWRHGPRGHLDARPHAADRPERGPVGL